MPEVLGSVQMEVEALIQGLQLKDSRLHQALLLLNKQVEKTTRELEPLTVQSSLTGGGTSSIASPTGFSAITTGTTVRFSWNAVSGAANYEIRKGADWDTATLQTRTIGLTADIDPLLYGSHTFLIKSIDGNGDYSVTPAQTIITINQIAGPTITKQTIDNNVLLNWTVPVSQFNIKHYIVKKDAVQIGVLTGTFAAIFETVAGTYTYSVTAVDIAGNVGTESNIPVQVNAPPDFALQDTRISALGGTKVNTLLHNARLLCCWVAETFQNHFVSRTWNSPQDQVNAGYPIYIQPASTTGSYEEIFDYGTVISNIIVVVTYNVNVITPASAVTVTVKMAVSDDDITYTSFVSGASQFYSQFRYLKLKLEFTGADDKALIELYNLTINISVKRENDGGEITANSGDAGGTTVTFNKPFKDIESLTATVKSTTEPYVTIIKFTDVPNPTGFEVFAFDTTGNRVTKVVEWKARGIV